MNPAWFYGQVKPGGPWDVKLRIPWETQFGQLRFPDRLGTSPTWHNDLFVYRGIIIDKAYLGNITYGYLGTASGYPLELLKFGSNFAAGFKDDPEDIPQIIEGIGFYRMDFP